MAAVHGLSCPVLYAIDTQINNEEHDEMNSIDTPCFMHYLNNSPLGYVIMYAKLYSAVLHLMYMILMCTTEPTLKLSTYNLLEKSFLLLWYVIIP